MRFDHTAQRCEGKSLIERCFAAIAFFTEVMEVAETEGHHPDLHLTNYRDVKVGPAAPAIKLAYARCRPHALPSICLVPVFRADFQ